MLSDQIRKYRKEKGLSQDELAEKLGVSRQSISLWENGQTQPTIENILALARIFNVSTDAILGNTEEVKSQAEEAATEEVVLGASEGKRRSGMWIIIAGVATVVILVGAVLLWMETGKRRSGTPVESGMTGLAAQSELAAERSEFSQEEMPSQNAEAGSSFSEADGKEEESSGVQPENSQEEEPSNRSEPAEDPKSSGGIEEGSAVSSEAALSQATEPFDLFTYCKDFAIEKGVLNGDYCMYQQPAAQYGGYEGEYFSISYWGDSDMVEFCLHCPLSETFSINFYLRMRGKYGQKYEYLSSRYYRDTGESLRSAMGYIDPAVFSDAYPLSCDEYVGSPDGQDDFMEESRVGICDLIHCLKNFVEVEKMECGFSAFEFVNF